MTRVWLLMGCIVVLAACGERADRKPTYVVPKSERFLGVMSYDTFKPRAYQSRINTNTPADPNDSYSRGYKDGCQTMNSAVGTGLARTRGPSIKSDELINDAWYLRGYGDATTACTFVLDWELH